MINVIMPVEVGKLNEKGMKEVKLTDTDGNQRIIEADKLKIDTFIKEKEAISKSNTNRLMIGGGIGAAIAVFTPIVADSFKNSKNVFWKILGLAIAGDLVGSIVTMAIYKGESKEKLNKAIAKLEGTSSAEVSK